MVAISLLVLVAAIWMLSNPANPSSATASMGSPIRLYCAAGIKPVIAAAIEEYREETGAAIEVQYGGSGSLLSQLEVRPQGVDLYLAADSSYLETAREKGLVREILTLARLQPVVAVARGNPLGIDSIQSLLADNVRVGLANPDAAAVGKITRKVMTSAGVWDAIRERCKVFKPTVNEIANDVAIGSIDAAVVWDSTVAMSDRLDPVNLPEFESAACLVAVGITESTERPVEALRFVRFLNSGDRGKSFFAKHGFQTTDGDQWKP